MLVIVRAVERFHIYLYGINFTIVSDCNALVYAMNKANLNPRIARWTLTLQNYSFKVTHRSADRMTHVDALSRSVGYVNELPLERELELRQLADARVKEIADKLEYEEDAKFELIDGLVYRKSEDSPKFVVPDSMVHSVLKAHHDDMAHCGAEKTLKRIKQNYWFPLMRKKIYEYIENCFTCLMANRSVSQAEGETSLFPPANKPLETLHADQFGPLQATENKVKHVLVIVDAFTRSTWIYATKSTGTSEVTRRLREIFDVFGTPTNLVTDRGTAFTSNEFAEFIKTHGIKHRKVAVAAPWANGTIERVNRFLKTLLTKVCATVEDWARALGKVQY